MSEDTNMQKDCSEELMQKFIQCTHLMHHNFHGMRGGRGHFGCHHNHGFREGCGGDGEQEQGKFLSRMHGFRHREFGRMGQGSFIGQGRILAILLANDGITQKEIAEKLQIKPASVNELVGKLEKGEFVERRQNELDKRVTNIFLTEGGRFFAKKIEENHAEFSTGLFSALTSDEQRELLNLLQKLIDSLSNGKSDEDCHHKNHHNCENNCDDESEIDFE